MRRPASRRRAAAGGGSAGPCCPLRAPRRGSLRAVTRAVRRTGPPGAAAIATQRHRLRDDRDRQAGLDEHDRRRRAVEDGHPDADHPEVPLPGTDAGVALQERGPGVPGRRPRRVHVLAGLQAVDVERHPLPARRMLDRSPQTRPSARARPPGGGGAARPPYEWRSHRDRRRWQAWSSLLFLRGTRLRPSGPCTPAARARTARRPMSGPVRPRVGNRLHGQFWRTAPASSRCSGHGHPSWAAAPWMTPRLTADSPVRSLGIDARAAPAFSAACPR